MFHFNCESHKWTELNAAMKQKRILFSHMPQIDGKYYAIGGTVDSSIEFTDLNNQVDWTEIKNSFPEGYMGDDL